MKLKSIPHTIIVHTPTEAEAKELLAILHENGYEWNNKKSLIGDPAEWGRYKNDTVYFIDTDIMFGTVRKLYRCQYITLAEFKERYALNEDNFAKSEEDKPQPKFKVGDIVRYKGKRKVVHSINTTLSEPIYTLTMLDYQSPFNVEEHRIEPYTEPETKDDTKGKEPGESGNNSEHSQLDLCELLKGHEGETFYTLIAGKCTLKEINEGAGFPICIALDTCTALEYLTTDGKRFNAPDARCMLFPSRALYEQYPLDPYTAWMKWQQEQTIFHIRIEFQPYEERGEMKCGNMGTLHFDDLKLRTPADRDKCISEIKAIIEKYSK